MHRISPKYIYVCTKLLLVHPPNLFQSYTADLRRNNGFLRYWTLSNAPLFLLAAPMFTIMTTSSFWAWSKLRPAIPGDQGTVEVLSGKRSSRGDSPDHLLRLLVAPQAILLTFTLLNAHVQIITRMSSGYPVWYWWLATIFVRKSSKRTERVRAWDRATIVTRWMVIYAVIQGGLFASFLPPA